MMGSKSLRIAPLATRYIDTRLAQPASPPALGPGRREASKMPPPNDISRVPPARLSTLHPPVPAVVWKTTPSIPSEAPRSEHSESYQTPQHQHLQIPLTRANSSRPDTTPPNLGRACGSARTTVRTNTPRSGPMRGWLDWPAASRQGPSFTWPQTAGEERKGGSGGS